MKSKIRLKTKKFFMQNSPCILSCIGAVGAVATAILAVKATPKAVELIKDDSRAQHDGDPYGYTKPEAVKSCWKCYIPSAAVGAISLFCILSAGALSRHQQKSLASAYILAGNAYREYRNKVKKLYGEETDRKIREEIVKEKCKGVSISVPGLMKSSCLDFDGEEDTEVRLFYDSFSERYFETTANRVIQAEYHLNRNYTLRGCACLNEFYEFLGLKRTDSGDTFGWTMPMGIFWVDFDHQKTVLDDGLECYIIDFVFQPEPNYMEYD